MVAKQYNNYTINEVHINEIKPGDTIIHTDGLFHTVGRNNIKVNFMGTTLFGDSYMLGTVLVKKVEFFAWINITNTEI